MTIFEGFEKRAISVKKITDLTESGLRKRVGNSIADNYKAHLANEYAKAGTTAASSAKHMYLDHPKEVRDYMRYGASEVNKATKGGAN